MTGKAAWREPFYPLAPNVRFIPYGDADALDKELKVCDTIGLDIAAFIAEPVQGEAGARVPPDDFFPKVREICDKWGVLFIADEVQTGMGRTGTLWGIEHWGVAPDIMTMGKALGGAVIPVGCFTSTPEVFEPLMENPYIHTTTFGGNPMATSAVIGALHATLDEDIPRQAAEKGAWLMERFEELRAKHPDLLHEVRGLGLLIGLEYCSEEAGYAVATGLFGEGVLTGGTLFSAKTFRIEPPATLTQHEMDEVVARLDKVMGRVDAQLRDGSLVGATDAAVAARRTRATARRGGAPAGAPPLPSRPPAGAAPLGPLGVAVDEQRLAGDLRPGRRAHEQDRGGDVVGGDHRPQRDRRDPLREHLGLAQAAVRGLEGDDAPDALAVDVAGADRVDADAVRAELHGQRLHQADRAPTWWRRRAPGTAGPWCRRWTTSRRSTRRRRP